MKFQNVSYNSRNTFNKSYHKHSVHFLHFNANEEYFVPKSVVIVVAEYNGMKLITSPTSFNEEREANGTSYSVRFIHWEKASFVRRQTFGEYPPNEISRLQSH